MKAQDVRKLSAQTQEEIRIRAVLSVEKGQAKGEVAKLFGISRKAVGNWWKAYQKEGAKALKAKPKGRQEGQFRKLLPWQAAQIAKAVIDHHPEQLKLPFVLWTREAVRQLIINRFAIALHITTVGDYLKRWGFTPQKPARRALQRNDAKVKQWLEEEYPAIQARAQEENARIYWEDEMGCRSDHTAGRSYSKRGKTPLMQVSGNRFSCQVVSAINNSGNLAFMVFKGSFVTAVFLNFLKRLIKHSKQKIFLIVDGHPVHKAKVITQWLEVNKEKIELFLLPSYSPELNPDEFLNQNIKSNVFKKKRPKNQAELIYQLREYLYSRKRHPQKIANLFLAPTVRYAAA